MEYSSSRPGTLTYYINAVAQQLEHMDSTLYGIAIKNFQVFCSRKGQSSNQVSADQYRVDEIFSSVSFTTLKDSPLLSVVLISSLIEIPLGDKEAKASRMLREIQGVINIKDPPVKDPIFCGYFKKILLWGSKVLKKSIQLTLQPIREQAINLIKEVEIDYRIAGFRLLTILIENFPSSIESSMTYCRAIVIKSFKHPDKTVREVAMTALQAILVNADDQTLQELCSNAMKVFTKRKMEYYEGMSEAIGAIIDSYPQSAQYLQFDTIPLDAFLSKEPQQRTPAYYAVPICYRTTPHLFAPPHLETMFNKYLPNLKKKTPCRNEALIGLAKLIFEKKDSFTEGEINVLSKCKKEILDPSEMTPESAIAVIAIQTTQPQQFQVEAHFEYSLIQHPLVAHYLSLFIKKFPSQTEGIHRRVLSYSNGALLSLATPPDQVIKMFQVLLSMNVSVVLFSLPLVLEYSLHLTSGNLGVKEAASKFILNYHSQRPSIEIAQRMLSIIATEGDTNLRIMILKNLLPEPRHPSIVKSLSVLIHDLEPEVRLQSLKYLTIMSDFAGVPELLNDILLEKVRDLQHSSVIIKEHIECFLIVSSSAFSNQSAPCASASKQVLVPFAQFLIKHLMSSSKRLTAPSLQLLAQLLPLAPNGIDVVLLSSHIAASLLPHSSKNRLDAALDLLISALDYFDFRCHITTNQSSIIVKLLQISTLPKSHVSREKIMKIVGSIGAVKPSFLHLLLESHSTIKEQPGNMNSPNLFIAQSKSNDPYQSLVFASIGVALLNILDILADELLSTLHTQAIDALLTFLKSFRQLNDDLEAILLMRINALIQNGGTSTVSTLLSNMATLITALGDRFKPLVPHVIDLVCNKWNTTDPVVLTRTCEWLMLSIPDAFIPYLPRVASLMVTDFLLLPSKTIDIIISAFVSFGTSISSVDHIVYPPLLDWVINNSSDTNSCSQVLIRIRSIFINGGTEKFSAPIFRAMIKATQANNALHNKCLDILFVVAFHIGNQFLLYIQMLSEVFNFSANTQFQMYAGCVEIGVNPPNDVTQMLRPAESKKRISGPAKTVSTAFVVPTELPNINPPHHSFEESQWITWYEELFHQVVRSSASRAISACTTLAERHAPVHESIFPIAFALVYYQFETQNNDGMVNIIKAVFKSTKTPRHILRRFLAVLELIEVLGSKPPVSVLTLAQRAVGANSIAQALRAYEFVFETNEGVTEDLVILNQQLGLPQAANGVLRCTAQRGAITGQGELAERLGLWSEALDSYTVKLEQDPTDSKFIEGKMKCLDALNRYRELKDCSQDPQWIVFRASALWGLFQNQGFLEETKLLQANTPQSKFFKLLSYVMTDQYSMANKLLSDIKSEKIDKLFPMIFEDYERAFADVATVSALNEVEDVMSFMKAKKMADVPIPIQKESAQAKMEKIKQTWDHRFSLLPDDPSVLFTHLRIRSLVLNYIEMKPHWLRLLDCSIKGSRVSLAHTILEQLTIESPNDEDLEFISSRIQWAQGNQDIAIQKLSLLSQSQSSISATAQLLLGQWYTELNRLDEALIHLKKSVELAPKSAEAWKSWSQLNLVLFESTSEQSYIVNSFEASLNGLQLSPSDPLGFTLRILSTLFRRGSAEVYSLFRKRIESIHVYVWIHVLPQIIARSNSEDTELREIILSLLLSIGKHHPHAAIYSLMVPLKSDTSIRQQVASKIFDQLKLSYPDTVEGVLTFSNELIRVAVTWWELWSTQLDEASRAYLFRNDHNEMLSLLKPLHERISREPQTYFEVVFMSAFGQQLSNAEVWLKRFESTHEEEALLQAWQIYISIFHQLKPIIAEMNEIPLKDASPTLASLRNIPLAVPGTYVYGQPIVCFREVGSILTVMKSKQRPRRMAIYGDDGNKYTFLLKAHEDTRLDERVMQLFTFINTLVSHSSISMKNRLTITTYKVIPLTVEVGLIGWVPDCNTLYDLVKTRREKLGIPLEIEYQTTLKSSPNFENLPTNDKAFAFKKGLATTKGDDLKIIMLTQSVDSQHWIERRTAYSTSLAMTSMAGYILGLGDRHLCNIMIKSKTAKLVHIDFGDCFEVAMHREKAPEKVPFRLTRILTNSLEVSKIEGTFKSCCQNVMGLMRDNGEQINGLLEVFIYDPLLQWIDQASESSSVAIIGRIKDKLSGKDFTKEKLGVNEQVDRLIQEATDVKNLCHMFRGWFPWW